LVDRKTSGLVTVVLAVYLYSGVVGRAPSTVSVLTAARGVASCSDRPRLDATDWCIVHWPLVAAASLARCDYYTWTQYRPSLPV